MAAHAVYFVYEHEADIERMLTGLGKAGVPEVPDEFEARAQDRLTGAEIKSLVFGHELRGRRIVPEADYSDAISQDGSNEVTVGSWSNKGNVWVQGDFFLRRLSEASRAVLRRRVPQSLRDP